MRTLLAVLLLAAVTTAWFGLALVPALTELVRGTDVEPLQLQRGGGDVRHFALTFQRFADAELDLLDVRADALPADGGAVLLRGGEPAWYVPAGAGRVTLPSPAMPADTLASRVVLSERAVATADGSQLLKEVYLRSLEGGADSSYRAVLAAGDVLLGPRSLVLRWIDAGGSLVAGEDSVLWGRASATDRMRLLDGTRFQRVVAPAITFGSAGADDVSEPAPDAHAPADADEPFGVQAARRPRPSVVLGTRAPLEPPQGVTESWGRWLIPHDFEVPAGAHVVADLIVSGRLRVGAGARVHGAVKCGVLEGAAGVIYDGAIVAAARMTVGAGSEVAGPVVVEGEARIGALCQVGTMADPTTISAVTVRIGGGAVVHGEVWAREAGSVDGGAAG